MAGREGTTLGPYRLTRRLGGGVAGDVFLAEGPAHSGTPGVAVVKVLRGSSTDDASRQMATEAQAISTLHLSHVLPIYGVGDDHGAVYVAMAHAPGGSLGTALSPSGTGMLQLPLGAGVVARLVTQTARALHPIHERGLVHGDLKLNNLFVRTAPHGGPMVAVADFGQRLAVAAAAADILSGRVEGPWAGEALRCVAPEQLTGQPVPASDQYALAAIAYLLLVGRYPFPGDTRGLGMAVLHKPPAPPSQIDPALARNAEAVLLRALAKSPASRFPDVATFALALEEGLAGEKGPGVSQTFSMLAGLAPARSTGRTGTHAAVRAPTASRLAATSPTRSVPSLGGTSGVRRAPPPHGARRRFTDGGMRTARRWQRFTLRQRMAALAACALALILVTAGGLGLRALTASSSPGVPLPSFGGLDYAPTLTPDATRVAQQHKAAERPLAQLAATLRTPPVFSDTLKSDSQHWSVDGKSAFFGTDGRLHLYNQSSRTILTLDQPVGAPGDLAITVDLSFVRGSPGDPAGLRFRASGSGDSASFYAALISSDGRFELWRYDNARWVILNGGYSASIKRGLGQTNTLALLATGTTIDLFVNGQFVTEVQDDVLPGGPRLQLGPIVIFAGSEVTYANYAVYSVAR